MKKILLFMLFLSPQAFAQEYQVLGIGCPNIDYTFQVTDEVLARFELEKGHAKEISLDSLDTLVSEYGYIQISTGDCVSNTIKGLAALGVQAALTGTVSNDSLGDMIRHTFAKLGVSTFFTSTLAPSSQIACLITDEGQRSFLTYCKAEEEITTASLKPEIFKGAKLVYMEGYHLKNGAYVEKAMEMGKSANSLIAIDLASSTIASAYRERIFALLENFVDIVFLNEEEAFALTQLPPDRAAKFLKNFCPLVVIKVGAKGAYVSSKNEYFLSPAIPTTVVDSTGAGDLFASAFIYAYLKDCPLEQCAYLGNLAGSAGCQLHGAELSKEKWTEIQASLLEVQTER